MASSKDKVTRAHVESLLAEFRKNAASSSVGTSKRGFDARVKGIAGLQGAITLDERSGKPLTRLRDPKGMQPKDPKTIQYLKQTAKADAESARRGEPRKHGKSIFNRVVDVLSRGNFASANAVYEGQKKAMKAEDEGKGWFDELGSAVSAMPGGFMEGLKGKKKTTFHKVLDLDAERNGGKKDGGFGRAAKGLFLDIALDPTTYMGVGLATKAATKSKDAVKLVNEAADLESKLAKTTNAPVESIRSALQAQHLPTQAVKKRHLKGLSGQGRVLLQAVQETKPASSSRFVNAIANKYRPSTNAHTRKVFADITDEKMHKSIADALDGELKSFPGLNGFIDRVKTMEFDNSGTMASANKDSKVINIGEALHTTPKAKAVQVEEMGTGWSSVISKTPEDFAKGVVVHEIGHHVSYAMPDNIVEALKKKIIDKAPKNSTIKGPNPQTVNALRYLFSKKKTGDLVTVAEIKKLAPGKTDEVYNSIFDKLKADGWLDDTGRFHGDSSQAKDYFDNLANPDIPYHAQDFLKDNLSGYSARNFHETMAEAWAEYRIMGDKARPLAREIAQEMEKHMPVGPTTKESSQFLRELALDSVASSMKFGQREGATTIEKLMPHDLVEKFPEGKAAVDALYEELIAAAARNMSGKIKKEFQLRIGPTSFGIPKSAEAVQKAMGVVGSVPFIKQSINTWNKAFRASAHIPESLNFLRQQSVGNSTFLITAHGKELQSIFDKIPRAARQGLLASWREGATSGNAVKGGLNLNGQPVDDVMAYLVNEIKLLDASRKMNGISRKELNSFLQGNHAIMVPTKATTRTKTVTKTDEFGRKYNEKITETTGIDEFDDMIEQALKANHKIKDPAQALFLYSAALNQAIAKRKMWDTVANTHGVPVGDLSKTLVSKHGWREAVDSSGKPINPGVKGFVFPEEVAHGMERVNEVFRDSRSTGMLIDQYDKALMGFKSVVTRYNPSFHTRTFLGEMLLGYMGGMKNIPKSYALTAKVIKGRNQHFLGREGEVFGEGSKQLIQASNALRNRSAMSAGVVDGSRHVFTMPSGEKMTADKIWHLYLEMGLKSGFASTDLARGVDAPVLGKTVKVGQAMQTLTESVEDYGRLAHFIDVLMHTKTKNLDAAAIEAAQTVRKFHLDYTNVTKWEKNVMTRAAPFYKWIRLSTPVMAEILLTQPGKALMVPKTMRAVSEAMGYDTENFGAFPGGPDAVVPEFLRDHGATPWANIAGNTNYFDPTALFPLAGSSETAGDPLRAASPYFKWASDAYVGKDKMQNKLSLNPFKGDMPHYLASQIPQTNAAEQLITKRDPGIPRVQTVAQFLGNPGNQPNTEKRMRGEAFRQQQEAYSHRKRLKEEKGIKK